MAYVVAFYPLTLGARKKINKDLSTAFEAVCGKIA